MASRIQELEHTVSVLKSEIKTLKEENQILRLKQQEKAKTAKHHEASIRLLEAKVERLRSQATKDKAAIKKRRAIIHNQMTENKKTNATAVKNKSTSNMLVKHLTLVHRELLEDLDEKDCKLQQLEDEQEQLLVELERTRRQMSKDDLANWKEQLNEKIRASRQSQKNLETIADID